MNTPTASLPMSAFAPISFTFRILERDFLGVAGPLFVAGFLGHLDWVVLGFGLVDDLTLALAIEAVWLVIGSYSEAGMLSFCLKIARGQPYGYRSLRSDASSVLALVGLRLIFYAALAASALPFMLELPRELLGTPGLVVLTVLLLVLWAIAMTRSVIAAALVVDERIGTLHALARSVKLTRGYGAPIFLYGVILLMIGGMVQTLAPGAVLAAIAAPGIVFLSLAVRGELVS
jgi:hypothetical protein